MLAAKEIHEQKAYNGNGSMDPPRVCAQSPGNYQIKLLDILTLANSHIRALRALQGPKHLWPKQNEAYTSWRTHDLKIAFDENAKDTISSKLRFASCSKSFVQRETRF